MSEAVAIDLAAVRDNATNVAAVDAIQRFRAKSGDLITIRFADPRDRNGVQDYFRSLSVKGRYERFLGAMGKLPEPVLNHFLQPARRDRLTILATIDTDGCETVVGEACYAFDADGSRAEGALSVLDCWRRLGIGRVLVTQLECLAARAGALRMYGEILYSNEAVMGLARACGYPAVTAPSEWRLKRIEKLLDFEALLSRAAE